MVRFFCLLAACLVLAVGQSSEAQLLADVVTPGFGVTVDRSGWIRASYRGIPIVTGENFDVSRPGWKGKVFPVVTYNGPAPYRVRCERRDQVNLITMTSELKDVAANAVVIEVELNRLRIENRYKVAASPEVGYVMTDCFLNKDLLNGAEYEDDAGHKGVLRVEGGAGIPNENLHSVSLKTKYGTIAIQANHEHTVAGKKGAVGWQFRNICDRTWGTEDRRSFSVLNLLTVSEPAPIEGRSEYIFTFDPSANLAEELSRRRNQQEAERQALMTTRGKRLAARQARIEAAGGIELMPKPQRMERLDGEFVIANTTRIVVGDGATEADRRAAALLAEELRDYYRINVPIVSHSQAGKSDGDIVIGRPEINPPSKAILEEWGQSVTPDNPGREGYHLEVRPGKALVAGCDAHGTWYGVQALVQLLKWRGRQLTIPCVRVRDWPTFRTRAMMLTLGVRDQMPFLKQTLRRVLPRARLNMVFVGGASLGRVSWPSHPEVGSDNSFQSDDIRDLADFARANFIEPVPHVQGFGHTGNLNKVHPELVIDPKSSSAFDITKPEARQFVFDLYGDAIKAFRPDRYFHVGFDEAKGLEIISRDRDVAEVVADHITAVSDWLKQRDLRMVMWADMLLDCETFKGNSAANSGNPSYGNVKTAPALDRIPKSVVLANWYYGSAEAHPALRFLKDRGFTVFPTTWFGSENNFNFIRSAHEDKLDWVSGSSWMYCSATNPGMMSLLTGEYAWTPDTPTLAELNYEPTELLASWLKPPRPSGVPCEQAPVDIQSAMNRSYVDDVPGDDVGWMDLGAEHDLSALKPGGQQMGRYLFDVAAPAKGVGCVLVKGPSNLLAGVPTKAEIPIGRRCDSLVFLHTVHFFNYDSRALGAYVIAYEDGSEVSVPLRNAVNIGPWQRTRYNRHFGAARVSGYYLDTERAWVGYTLGGEEVDLVAFEWINPKPDARVTKVRVELHDRSRELAIAILGITAIDVFR